jgi:hypothetical protein
MLLDIRRAVRPIHTFPLPVASIGTADTRALGLLTALTAIVAWNRFRFDSWLARFDIMTFYLPWYAYLGERLRAFDVPGWNPHLFSGTPFAADPQSGWMYLPAMLAFPLFGALAAYKAMVAVQLAVAALSTYALARALGLGAMAGLVATIVFLFGPFLQWNTDCCAVMAQFAAWVPLTLLGVELALRTGRWRHRLLPWCLAGLGFSQILGGWVGEGWLDGFLLVGTYVAYRSVISPPRRIAGWRPRLIDGASTGAAAFGIGLALGAAGVLPRLAVNAETNLAGGNYARLGDQSVDHLPWHLSHLIGQIVGSGYDRRATAFGGAATVLSLLALPLARRRFAAPYFAGLTVVCLILTLDTTPLHQLFYLIPRFRVIHEHDPWRVVAVCVIGPAMLSGAAVEALAHWPGRRRRAPLVAIPLVLLVIAAAALPRSEPFVGWAPLLVAAIATATIAAAIVFPGRISTRYAPALLLVAAFAQPMGTDLTGSWFDWPHDPKWEQRVHPAPVVASALATEVEASDPTGAGAFLKRELATAGPFRYAGYGGVGYPADRPRLSSYMGARLQANIQAILVNGRPMFLGLYDVQGYDPIQLARYVDTINALNSGVTQDYHTAYLLAAGARSPLLDLLDVRYLLVDAGLPSDRPDVAAFTAGRREVFRTDRVVVYATGDTLGHAWIVHDVRTVAENQALSLLANGKIDPRTTALVEGAPPTVAVPADPSAESARVTRYEPDEMKLTVNATAPGLLVVSETYATGWRATVDGRSAPILATDYLLRGIPIPSGAHTVELRYAPRSLTIGLWISAFSSLAMLAVFVVAGWSYVRGNGRAGSAVPPLRLPGA